MLSFAIEWMRRIRKELDSNKTKFNPKNGNFGFDF